MHTTIQITGTLEQILEEAVEGGLAKTKTEALRMGVLELNNRYHLLERSQEDELAVKKMQRLDKDIREKKRKLLDEDTALGKYR